MAEIRKHDPAVGNAIAQALRAAMGDPVRPNQPGNKAEPSAPVTPEPTSTTWVSLQVKTEDAES